MKKISKGAPKKWTSTPGSYGNSYLIEGGSGSRDNEPYDKYVGYVAEKDRKVEQAFKTAPYGRIKTKCPKCGSECCMRVKKKDMIAYKCSDCKNRWEKTRRKNPT